MAGAAVVDAGPRGPDARRADRCRWAVVALAVVPSLAWIALDRQPFGGDQSQYAAEAVTLFDALLRAPARWPRAMALTMDGFKAPGLPWLGQAFVPVGMMLGRIDAGLLLLVALIQALAVRLTYSSLRALGGPASVALLGSLVILAAPLQVMLSHEFLVEPLQMLTVVYFIWIMVHAPQSGRERTLAHLLLAAALGMAAKVSTPLFCVGPGVAALARAVTRGPRDGLRRSTVLPLAAGSSLAIASGAWYWLHLDTVRAHARVASSGAVALHWGKDDTFLGSLGYWAGALADSTWLVRPVAAAVVGFVLAGALAWFVRGRRGPGGDLAMGAGVAALQLATVLAVFSLADVRVPRYLLACLPYAALLVGWAAFHLGAVATVGALAAAAVQLAIVHAFAFGVTAAPPLADRVRVVERGGEAARVLEALVRSTCYDRSARPYPVIVGIDPALRGDWLAPVPAEYVRARHLAQGETPACVYEYLGGDFFGGTAAEVWEHMLGREARYLVMTDPAAYPPPPRTYNRALGPDQLPALMKSVGESGVFQPAVRLREDPGILLFRRAE